MDRASAIRMLITRMPSKLHPSIAGSPTGPNCIPDRQEHTEGGNTQREPSLSKNGQEQEGRSFNRAHVQAPCPVTAICPFVCAHAARLACRPSCWVSPESPSAALRSPTLARRADLLQSPIFPLQDLVPDQTISRGQVSITLSYFPRSSCPAIGTHPSIQVPVNIGLLSIQRTYHAR